MKIEAFNLIGIAIRTTNENDQSATDIPLLWNRLMNEGVLEKIPNKVDNTIYSVYTEYEKDHTKPYTTILGCQVTNLDVVPEGLIGKVIAAANYSVQIAKGNLMQGAVFNAWTKIWNSDLQRTFTADYEVYGVKAQNPEDAEVNIYVAVK